MRFLFSMLACALLASTARAQVLLFEDFEDSALTFTVSDPLFHDGAGDYYTIVPLTFSGNPLGSPAEAVVPYTGFGGSSFFAAEDVDDGGIRPDTRTMTFTVTGTNLTNLSVDVLFAASGNAALTPAYDANDGFLIRASLDGAPFQNLLAFEAEGATNQLLRRDTNFDGVGDGFLPSSAFTAFNNLAITGTGNSLTVEVIVTSNDGNTEFAIDNLRINGLSAASAAPEPSTLSLVGIFGAGMLLRRRRN